MLHIACSILRLEKRNPRGPGPQILSSTAPFIFSPPRGFFTLSLLSPTPPFVFLLPLRLLRLLLRGGGLINSPFVLLYSCVCPIPIHSYIRSFVHSFIHSFIYFSLVPTHTYVLRICLSRFLLPVQTAGMKLKLSNIQQPPTLC